MAKHNPISNLGSWAHPKGGGKPRTREYEGSAADKKQDAKGMRETGMTSAQYEKSARDKREDARGGRK